MLERNSLSFSKWVHKCYIRRSQRKEIAKLDDGELIVSIPFERLKGIAEAIDLSTAGTAEPSEGWKMRTLERAWLICVMPYLQRLLKKKG